MKIAMINMTGGGMSGGYRAYLSNILPRLAGHPQVEAVLCLAPVTLPIRDWLPVLPSVTFGSCAPFRFGRHHPDASLRRLVKQFSPDVIFAPVERYLHFTGVPFVTMVQNMGPMVAIAGNPIYERLRYVLQRSEAKYAVRHASRVIAPTTFVRSFLVERWKIPTERLSVVHYGSVAKRFPGMMRKPTSIPDEWTGRFIFTAGSLEPYRGLEDLIEAYSMLDGCHGISGIVIAGEARKTMIPYYNKLRIWMRRRGIAERILWVGHLDQGAMSWCYQHCRLFSMTSRVESFSIIALEALAHGCISVVANNPPLPEIFGSTAHYYTPKDPRDFARTANAVLSWNHIERQRASQLAEARAATFSWDTAAGQTVEVFASAMERL